MPIPTATTGPTGQSVLGTVSSTITVPDSFIIEGDQTAAGLSVMQVELDCRFANDPDLTATLDHYDAHGTSWARLSCFSGVGSRNQIGQFHQHGLRRQRATPIPGGSAPFSAIYNPQESLATVFAPTGGQQGMNVQGTWTLVVQNSSTGTTGTLTAGR